MYSPNLRVPTSQINRGRAISTGKDPRHALIGLIGLMEGSPDLRNRVSDSEVGQTAIERSLAPRQLKRIEPDLLGPSCYFAGAGVIRPSE